MLLDAAPQPSSTGHGGKQQRAVTHEEVQVLQERFFVFEKKQRRQEEQLLAVFGSSLYGNVTKQQLDGPSPENTLVSRLIAVEEQLKSFEARFGPMPSSNGLEGNGNAPVQTDVPELAEDSVTPTNEVSSSEYNRLDQQLQHLSRQHEQLQLFSKQNHDELSTAVSELQEAQQAKQTVSSDDVIPLEKDSFDQKMSPKEFAESLTLNYELAGSMWDSILLIGRPEIGIGGSCFMSLLVLCNCALQAVFVTVCLFNFTDPVITEEMVQAAKYFRTLIGHDDSWVSPSGETLTAMICTEETSMRMLNGGVQVEQLNRMKEYYSLDDSNAAFSGKTMTICALLSWSINVLRELSVMLAFAIALHGYQGARTITFAHSSCDSQTYSFHSIGPSRSILMLLSLIARICGALALYGVGCVWLANSPSVSDLLLNCLALGFVLDIDEMMFEALAPQRFKTILSTVEPLKIKYWPHIQGLEYQNFVFLSIPITGTIVFYQSFTHVMIQRMGEFGTHMCQPPTDFTFTVDPVGFTYLAQYSTSPPMDARGTFWRKTWNDVREVIDNGNTSIQTRSFNPLMFNKAVSFIAEMEWSATVNGFNADCSDALDSQPNTTRRRWLDVAHVLNSNASNCADLTDFCFRSGYAAQIVRAFCSQTCLCRDPESPVAMIESSFGCPDTCTDHPDFYKARLEASCLDRSADELRETSFWPVWSAWANATREGEDPVGDDMIRYGCQFARRLDLEFDACRGTMTSGLRPISIACPVLCQCDNSSSDMCPFGPLACATPGLVKN